jgi:hypothetical protein
MAVYQRGAGDHIAERVQPEPGSDEEKRLEALADDAGSDWHRAEAAEVEAEQGNGEPKRPSKADNKAAWVDWAVANDADRTGAEAMTKDDLIKAYGG